MQWGLVLNWLGNEGSVRTRGARGGGSIALILGECLGRCRVCGRAAERRSVAERLKARENATRSGEV